MKTNLAQLGHYVRRVIEHRHVRRAVDVFHLTMAVVAGAALLSIVVQLLYPSDRALPFSKIDTIAVGGLSEAEIKQKLESIAADTELTLKTPAKQYHTKWASVGVTIDPSATTRAMVEYAWWERLTPFSSVVRTARTAGISPIVIVDKERLKVFAEKIVAENKQAATEAALVIKNGQVKINSSKGGFAFTVEDVQRQLQAVPFHAGEQVALNPRIVPAAIGQDELVAVKLRAEQIISRELTLAIGDRTFKPDATVRGSWLTIAEDPVSHNIIVQLKKDMLEKYVAEVSAQVATPAGITKVTLLDGQEVSRAEGPTGKSVNVGAALSAVEKALFEPQAPTTIKMALESQAPKVEYTSSYSQGDAGLQALIQDWEAGAYGTYGIIVREIGGQNRYAEFQPDRSFVTSSTYKMFIAYDIFIKMERGEITNDTVLDMGWTVNDCMNEMILHSTNPCAISFQNWLGWQTSEDMIHAAGFTSTFVNNQAGGDKRSTVRDETNFMLRLQAGTLLNPEHTERLLSLFKRQVWRGGIPSGVPRGTVVADKVGFYNGYVHDVGIIYGPNSTYILGIMSRGGSDPVFAGLSRRVYNFFHR